MTRNVVIDRARREAARPSVPTAEVHELAPPVEPAAESVATTMTVRSALADLAPAQRELVRLAYFEQLTQKEIAERLGLPIGTVKSRTFHALRELRGLLQESPVAGIAPARRRHEARTVRKRSGLVAIGAISPERLCRAPAGAPAGPDPAAAPARRRFPGDQLHRRRARRGRQPRSWRGRCGRPRSSSG